MRRALAILLLIFSAAPAGAADGDGPRPIGYVVEHRGEVTFTRRDGTAQKAVANLAVFPLDQIRTRSNSGVKILFDNDSVLSLGENTRMSLDEFVYKPAEGLAVSVFKLIEGRVRAAVSRLFQKAGSRTVSRFEIHTPTAVAGVRGTDFMIWLAEGATEVLTLEGEVYLRNLFDKQGRDVIVPADHFSRVRPGFVPARPGMATDAFRRGALEQIRILTRPSEAEDMIRSMAPPVEKIEDMMEDMIHDIKERMQEMEEGSPGSMDAMPPLEQDVKATPVSFRVQFQ